MPTGYTGDIHDGTDVTLHGYIIKCARAMGFLIQDRDGSGKLPDHIPFDSSDDEAEIAALQKEIDEISTMDDDALDEKADRDYQQTLRDLDIYGDEKALIRSRYSHVSQQIIDWTPPPLLKELKKFMISQIDESITHDCDLSRTQNLPPRMMGIEYQEMIINDRTSHIEYIKRRIEKNRDINVRSNALLQTLHEELAKVEAEELRKKNDVVEEEEEEEFIPE